MAAGDGVAAVYGIEGDAADAEVRGGTHVGMYDLPQNVTPAVAKLTQFFGEHLAG